MAEDTKTKINVKKTAPDDYRQAEKEFWEKIGVKDPSTLTEQEKQQILDKIEFERKQKLFAEVEQKYKNSPLFKRIYSLIRRDEPSPSAVIKGLEESSGEPATASDKEFANRYSKLRRKNRTRHHLESILEGVREFKEDETIPKKDQAYLESLNRVIKDATEKGEIPKTMDAPDRDISEKLARAKKMGFDVDNVYYHGSPFSNIDEFKLSEAGMFGPGVYLTKDPTEASKYATRSNSGVEGDATVYPLHTRGRLLNRKNYSDVWALYKEIDPSIPDLDFSGEWWKDPEKAKIYNSTVNKIEKFLESQNKSTAINEMVRNSKIFSGIQEGDHRVIFDPKNIRSKFAKFDSDKSDSSNISSLTSKGSALESGVLDKAFKAADVLSIASDLSSGNVADAAVSAAQTAAPKLGFFASRAAPFLDLLRPTSMMSEEQAREDDLPVEEILLEKSRNFKKLKKLFEGNE